MLKEAHCQNCTNAVKFVKYERFEEYICKFGVKGEVIKCDQFKEKLKEIDWEKELGE